MTSADLSELRRTLVDAEGLKLKPYTDTRGVLTIGVGRNLRDVGLSRDECLLLLENDVSAALRDCERTFQWFNGLDSVRQLAVVEMRFQLGLGTMLEFTQTLAAIAAGDYEAAARSMLASAWGKQTPKRVKRLAQAMRIGAKS